MSYPTSKDKSFTQYALQLQRQLMNLAIKRAKRFDDLDNLVINGDAILKAMGLSEADIKAGELSMPQFSVFNACSSFAASMSLTEGFHKAGKYRYRLVAIISRLITAAIIGTRHGVDMTSTIAKSQEFIWFLNAIAHPKIEEVRKEDGKK